MAGKENDKGKGKVSEHASSSYATGPLQTPLPADNQLQDVKQAVLAVLPEAARLRAQSTLVESEWTVPVFHRQALGKQPGIALAPKHSLASVIQQVGFTSHSVAVIVTENPDDLGLRGYAREKVNCLLSVMGDDGVRAETVVTRHLVQLGFGSPVAQLMMGQQVDMLTIMKRMQIKLPERLGWPAGPFPASIIMHELKQIAPSHAIDGIICRQGDAATFLVHGSCMDAFLKASGKRSTFFKIVQDTSDFELLWLEEGVSIDDAIKLSDHEDAYGVVSKGKSSFTRFAIRFRDISKMQAFAIANSIEDTSKLGRFKVSGIHQATGLHGLLAFLTAKKWINVQVLYITEGRAVFLAEEIGEYSPMFYIQDSVQRQLHFKALNAAAKNMIKTENLQKKSLARTPARQTERMQQQQAFLTAVGALPQSGSNSANPNRDKRPPVKTGETPDPKRKPMRLKTRTDSLTVLAFAAVDRNHLMHALNGNIRMIVANTTGVSVTGRWESILHRCQDIVVLSEAHCTNNMQKSLPYSAQNYHIVWGHPVSKGSRSGVAILVHKAKAWTVKQISLVGAPCHTYYEQGRLVLAQVVVGNGNRSFSIYAVYGHAGARWEADRRKELELMLRHIGDDVASRGATPAFITGDFNIQVAESLHIQTLLRTNLFVDAKDWGTPSEQIKKTSHKHNGSRIDLCLANQSGSMLLKKYAVRDGSLPKGHSESHIDIDLPIGKQWRYIPVQPNQNHETPYDLPPKNSDPPIVDISDQLHSLLDQGYVDKAFSVWCSIAESYLKQIPHTKQNHETFYDTGSGRGKKYVSRDNVCSLNNQMHSR